MCANLETPTQRRKRGNTGTDGYSVSTYSPAVPEAHLSSEISSLIGFYFYYLFHVRAGETSVPLIVRTETISLQLGTLEVSQWQNSGL